MRVIFLLIIFGALNSFANEVCEIYQSNNIAPRIRYSAICIGGGKDFQVYDNLNFAAETKIGTIKLLLDQGFKMSDGSSQIFIRESK